MNSQSTPSDEHQPRDAAYWAQDAATLQVVRAPTGALNLNVQGRRAMSPLQGFGQLWQKTFRIRLHGAQVTPAEVITTWKERFPTFWPKWDRFYLPLTGLAPGEVALINMVIPGDLPHGLPLSTGVLVLYADEESFTFMNPQGHMFAGWITFSAYEEEGYTVAQIQMLIRPNDLAYELGFRLFTVLYRMLTPLRWLLASVSHRASTARAHEMAERTYGTGSIGKAAGSGMDNGRNPCQDRDVSPAPVSE